MKRKIEIFTDGACRGNPGEAAIAFVVLENGNKTKEFSRSIGVATNNIAEYTAVIYALQEALISRYDELVLYTDSELFSNQFNGSYKVKNPNIRPLFDQIKHLVSGFKRIEVKHIFRDKNKEADKLAKQAIKKEQAKMVALGFNFGEESPSSKG